MDKTVVLRYRLELASLRLSSSTITFVWRQSAVAYEAADTPKERDVVRKTMTVSAPGPCLSEATPAEDPNIRIVLAHMGGACGFGESTQGNNDRR